MAPTQETTGNTAQTQGGAESTVQSWSTAKTRVLSIDLALLADGESIAVRIYNKATTGGTEAILYEASYFNVQYEKNVCSPPIPCLYAGSFRIIQYAGGTSRAFPYSVATLD